MHRTDYQLVSERYQKMEVSNKIWKHMHNIQ